MKRRVFAVASVCLNGGIRLVKVAVSLLLRLIVFVLPRTWVLALSMHLVNLEKKIKSRVLRVGLFTRRIGKQIVSWASNDDPKWNPTLFHQCFFADVEFHVGGEVYRGPLQVAFANSEGIFFKLNWVARKTEQGWISEGGMCDFRIRDFGPPHRLPNGDVWCMYQNGNYIILFIGLPREHIPFCGDEETPRIYTYF